MAQHRQNPECASCHNLMDVLGYGFESFDDIGRYRTTENGMRIDDSGEFVGTDIDGAFKGPVELGRRLAASPQVQKCVTKQWFRYALGRVETDLDQCSLDAVYQRFQKSDFRLPELLMALVESDAFRIRRGEEIEMKPTQAKTITRTITRRSLISRGVAGGLAAGLSPLLPVFERKAEAQARGRRHQAPDAGVLERRDGVRELPAHRDRDQLVDLRRQMKALEPFKKKMTIYANIRRAQDNAKGSHQAGTSGIWTAARMLGTGTGGWVSHPSIDADHQQGSAAEDRHPGASTWTACRRTRATCAATPPTAWTAGRSTARWIPAGRSTACSRNGIATPVSSTGGAGRPDGGRQAAGPAQERAGSGALRAADPAEPAWAGRIARSSTSTWSSCARPRPG